MTQAQEQGKSSYVLFIASQQSQGLNGGDSVKIQQPHQAMPMLPYWAMSSRWSSQFSPLFSSQLPVLQLLIMCDHEQITMHLSFLSYKILLILPLYLKEQPAVQRLLTCHIHQGKTCRRGCSQCS